MLAFWIILLVVVLVGALLWDGRCPRCGKFFAATRGKRSTEGSSWWNRTEYQHYSCGNCKHKWKRAIDDDVDIC